MSPTRGSTVELEVDGRPYRLPDDGCSLLEALRDRLGIRSPKDGCSPQGQCGCCTVLVDGAPRVACVTPLRRVAGRRITTADGLDEDSRRQWVEAFAACGASQCGFCTPGIIVRLEATRARRPAPGGGPPSTDAVERALAAHLCRCTGWQTIVEAAAAVDDPSLAPREPRDLDAASRRASLEGRASQHVGGDVPLGRAGFADDLAPDGALVAVPDGHGGWAVGETLAEARARSGKVQGRRTTVEPQPPVAVPAGDWERTLQTGWVEPAYLETDASWCEPGGEPVSPLANGGAFGAKVASPAPAAARRLADEHGRAVRVVLSREDTVVLGAKRPPMAAGVRADGSGVVHVARTPGVAAAIATVAPDLEVVEVDVAGPPTSTSLRGAGWAEAAVLLASVGDDPGSIRSPDGSTATAAVRDGRIEVRVSCGPPLDPVVLRSYCIGAAHMALGWVTSEGLAVDDDGRVLDLTVRSFGILRASETPPIDVVVDAGSGEPVNGSDAVFAAVAGAVWAHQGFPPVWPSGRPLVG